MKGDSPIFRIKEGPDVLEITGKTPCCNKSGLTTKHGERSGELCKQEIIPESKSIANPTISPSNQSKLYGCKASCNFTTKNQKQREEPIGLISRERRWKSEEAKNNEIKTKKERISDKIPFLFNSRPHPHHC